MSLTLEEIKSLINALGVQIPDLILEERAQAEMIKARQEKILAEAANKAEDWKLKPKFDDLHARWVGAADNHQFDLALQLLDEAEQVLVQPDQVPEPPPTAPVVADEPATPEVPAEVAPVASVEQAPLEPPAPVSTTAPMEPAPSEAHPEVAPIPAEEPATPEGAYRKEKAQLIGVIEAASQESAEIGGEDIKTLMGKVEAKEQAGDWPGATELLRETHRKAELLNERKPYITARQENIHKINAAKKIKKPVAVEDKTFGDFKTYGEAVTADWEAIAKLAENKDFNKAANGIVALGKKIDSQITPALAAARKQNAEELASLKDDLEKAKEDGNAEGMRNVAEKIFQNTSGAENLGIDPGENARKPFEAGKTRDDGIDWTVENCEATFKRYDWFALKKRRKEKKIDLNDEKGKEFSDDDMWKLVQYRGKVVNEIIDSLRKEHPTLIAKASGSEDIESDIDITFATPGSGEDVDAAEKFNAAIKDRFQKPPGRVFDVNIYPRDYGAIKESFKADYNVEEIKDSSIDEPDQEESAKLSKIDQDVATLLKQRRFLESAKFNEMLQTLLNGAPDEATRKRIEKQYEEGEDIYLQTSLEKVERIRTKVDLGEPVKGEPRHKTELREKLDHLDKLKGKSDRASLAQVQELIPQILDLFEEGFPDEAMDVTDAQYLEKMGSLRKDQASIRSLKKDNANADEHHPKQTCKQVHPKTDHDTWRKEQLNALEVKVKKDMFTNIVFANEAIMSQGALKHVVGALQAKTPEDRAKALKVLEASDLMQSVNEQVADLSKEMKHFEGVVEEAGETEGDEKSKASAKRRASGEGFVHASKYFFRLLDAAILLTEKYKNNLAVSEVVSKPYAAVKTRENLSLEALKKRVDDVLLKLRKSAVIPPDVKGEVGALEIEKIFPKVDDIPTFRKMITDFAIELNLRIRSLDDFKKSQEMGTDKEKAAEAAYFEAAAPKAAEPGSKEEAENQIRIILNKPLVADAKLTGFLEEAGIENGKAITAAWKAVIDAVKASPGRNRKKKGQRADKGGQEAFDAFAVFIGQLPAGDVQAALLEARDKLSEQFEIQNLAAANPKAFAQLDADFKNAEKLNAAMYPLLAELPKAALDDTWRRKLIAAQKQLQTLSKKLHSYDALDKEMPEGVLRRKGLLTGSLSARLQSVVKALQLPKCKPVATQGDFKKAQTVVAKTAKLLEKATKAGLTKASRAALTAAVKELQAADKKLRSTDAKEGQLGTSVLRNKAKLTASASEQLGSIKKMLGVEAPPAAATSDKPSAASAQDGRKAAQAQWQVARATAVAQLKSLGDAIKTSKDPQATKAIILLRSIQANLSAKPETLKEVGELEHYLQTDEIIDEAETSNGFGIKVDLRNSLLPALASLRASLAA